MTVKRLVYDVYSQLEMHEQLGAFSLSYCDVEELLTERGLSVDHVTVWRWVRRYAQEVERRLRGTSSRRTTRGGVDETYYRSLEASVAQSALP